MSAITFKELTSALKSLGLNNGDIIFVHSDLRSFGCPYGINTRDEILRFFFNGFMEVIGKEGTLAVPAFYYEYARYGEPFDVELSPVSKTLGVFAAYVNSQPGRIRSLNPLQSISAIGDKAENLCRSSSLAGYGSTSPWHRLRIKGAKFIFFGTSMQPLTFIHHVEQQFGVPHLYTKIYPFPVFINQVPVNGQPISAVRYLDYEIEYDLLPFQSELKRQGLLKEAILGSSSIYQAAAEDIFQLGTELLAKNPYFFLKNPPKFIPGQIPTDGLTMKK